MRNVVVRMLIISLILTALGTAPTVQAAELKLPLQYGLYLPAGVECPKQGETPASSLACYYHRQGLNIPRCRCQITQARNDGNVYHLTQKCLCRGEDNLNITLTITIKSKTSFSLLNDEWEQKRTGKKETVYHYCGNHHNP